MRLRLTIIEAWCVLLGLCLGRGVSSAGPATQPATVSRGVKEFLMVSEAQAQSAAFGMLMVCPAHGHGTPEEAEKKLRLLAKAGSEQPSTIWICRASQAETLRRFAPLVERIAINPFVPAEGERPTTDKLYWREANHAVLDELAALRSIAGDRQLLACLDIDGEPSLFGGRLPSFEEIEWQVLAVIGSGYQGIIWRSEKNDIGRLIRLRQLEGRLKELAGPLGEARPVDWARPMEELPVSALQSGAILFVVLLNPDYVRPNRQSGESISLPLEGGEQRGELELDLPAERRVVSARTLGGRELGVRENNGRVRIPYRFRGGGELLICRISDPTSSPEPRGVK